MWLMELSNPSVNPTNVGLPIKPGQHLDFRPEIQWRYEDGPRYGFRLATSIFQAIYYAWKDTANQPFTKARVERQVPFDEFEFTIRPSLQPGTTLTPLKTGVVYCWILYELLQLQQWPGHAIANIFQSRQNIGSITIDYLPLAQEPISTSSSVDNSSSDALTATPFQNQQRWLRCYWKAVQLAIAQLPTDRVTDVPAFAPQTIVRRYSIPCGNPGVTDLLDLFIYPDANAGSPTQLTWQILISTLLNWIINVARSRDNGRSTKVILNTRLVAEVSIFIQPQGVSDGNLTATA
ncbi:MAG: hypothetical protein Q9220_000123 [cf. Caloplaca sp. 1 TL-2023]